MLGRLGADNPILRPIGPNNLLGPNSVKPNNPLGNSVGSVPTLQRLGAVGRSGYAVASRAAFSAAIRRSIFRSAAS